MTFWEAAATKVPEKIRSAGFVSGARLCYEREMIATRIIFYLRKGMTRESPKCCFTLSVLPAPGPSRPLCVCVSFL
jgi:hypothetical protein